MCLLKHDTKLHWCAKTVSAECNFDKFLATHPHSYEFNTNIHIFFCQLLYPKKDIIVRALHNLWHYHMHNPVKMHVTHTRPRISCLKLPWRQLRRAYDICATGPTTIFRRTKTNLSINWLKMKIFFSATKLFVCFSTDTLHTTLNVAHFCIYDRKWCRRPLRLRGCLELNSDEWITTECCTRAMMMSVNRRIAALVWISTLNLIPT